MRDDVENELGEVTNLIIHFVAADIEYLAGDPLRFLVHAEKESLNDIVDVDKRPPLLAGAHDVNHPLLPGTQGHDVDGQVETHARRKAEHRGIAKDHGFEPGTCEISQFLLYAQLAFGKETAACTRRSRSTVRELRGRTPMRSSNTRIS